MLLSEIDIWQVPAEKLLKFLNSEIIFNKFNKLRDTSHTSEAIASDQMFGGDLKMAVERVLSPRFDSSLVPSNHLVNSTLHAKKIRHSYEQEVMQRTIRLTLYCNFSCLFFFYRKSTIFLLNY